MLIPGPKSPTKDIDVFLQPLIRELQTLWSRVWTRDVVTCSDFKMKAALLWIINDFPARSSLSGWFWQGYLACPTCNKDTPSAKVRGKIVYVGHRKFLRIRHTMRMKRTFNGKIDMTPIPKALTNANIMNQLRICAQKLMQQDMEKAKEQLINIMCSLEQIYPPAFFDVIIHLVMHLPEEAILGNFQTITWKRNFLAGLISSRVATPGPNGEMFYGQLKEILELTYIGNRKDDQDVIHDSNSSDVALYANLGDMDYTSLSINDESTEVDASPDNEVPDEESVDFIGDEDDVVPHVLKDDDQDDDVRDDDDLASVHVVSSDDSSEDENCS
nr:hypothetical protein [Tanacetum cinerariifolium]